MRPAPEECRPVSARQVEALEAEADAALRAIRSAARALSAPETRLTSPLANAKAVLEAHLARFDEDGDALSSG